jgi:hypothetical protein
MPAAAIHLACFGAALLAMTPNDASMTEVLPSARSLP